MVLERHTTNEIKEGMDILHFDLGPIIRRLHQESDPTIPLKDWIINGEQKYGSDFSNMVLCEELEKHISGDTPLF